MKNAQGDDSPATSKRDQTRRAADWLEIAGIEVHRAHSEPASVLEISPLFATSAEQLKTRKLPFTEIKPGQKLYFGESGPQEV